MTAPSPFDVAKGISDQFGGAMRRADDLSAIDEILYQANSTNNPQDVDRAMSQILSRVSPDRQQNALAILQNKQKNIQASKDAERTAASYKAQGFDPSLAHLPESVQKELISQKGLSDVLFPKGASQTSATPQEGGVQAPIQEKPTQEDMSMWRGLSLDQKAAIAQKYPQVAKALQEEDKKTLDREKFEHTKFEGERAYHTQFSKPVEEKAAALRAAIPAKRLALDYARNAVEGDDLSYFTKDTLAELTGQNLFRTAKGAQLVTAGKENLFSNITRVSAKAQNQWLEQRMAKMFPEIGLSKEAALTMQEMLEAENELAQLYLNEFDRIAKEDLEKYGYTRKDVDERAHLATKGQDKLITDRAFYRIQQQQESEKGLKSLKQRVGKRVVKGTPLTLAMARMYKEKFGQEALKNAEKDGYTIPTFEDWTKYESRPQEFREQVTL